MPSNGYLPSHFDKEHNIKLEGGATLGHPSLRVLSLAYYHSNDQYSDHPKPLLDAGDEILLDFIEPAVRQAVASRPGVVPKVLQSQAISPLDATHTRSLSSPVLSRVSVSMSALSSRAPNDGTDALPDLMLDLSTTHTSEFRVSEMTAEMAADAPTRVRAMTIAGGEGGHVLPPRSRGSAQVAPVVGTRP